MNIYHLLFRCFCLRPKFWRPSFWRYSCCGENCNIAMYSRESPSS